jgi:VWFA-related protein
VGDEVDDGETVRVETQLVSVPVSVTDKSGRFVGKLRAEDFSLYEDGRPQQITNFITTEAPFEVTLLLDTSGSTRAQLALIRRAANAFIAALRPGDRVSVVAFNTAEDLGKKLATVEVKTKLTSDRDELRQAVEAIGASSGTPFYDALEQVAENVFKEPPRKEISGRRALVALTDGVDSTSETDYAAARAALARKGVACYFIQINTEEFVEERLMRDCEDDGTLQLSRVQLKRYRKIFAPYAEADDYVEFCRMGPFQRMQISRDLYNLARREMNDLARVSGGSVAVADDLNDARRAFAQVAANIGTQFSLGYYPTNKARDGKYRAIRVEVKRSAASSASVEGPVTVRAREGYYAPSG